MVQAIKLVIATTLATAALASAHPGHHEQRSLVEMAQHRIFQSNARRSLGASAGSTSHRALQERAAARREAQLSELQHQRRLSAADVIAKSHKSNLTDVAPTVDPSTLFGSQPQCILEPEVTQGPYYVTGELIRNDVREEQPGIDLYTELQFIDVNTCEPVADLYVDFWHCNVTGVYAGVNANGNGDSNDLTNINNTFHRGLAPTNSEGIVQFITKFPGHYTGRTTHIHILSNHGGQVLSNNTYAGSSVPSVGQIFFDQDLLTEVSMRRSMPRTDGFRRCGALHDQVSRLLLRTNDHIHVLGTSGGSVLTNKTCSGGSVRQVGQVFFDQSLLTAVYATAPYTSNTATITKNADDSIFKQEAASFDPVMNYAYINENSIADGIFAYISMVST